MRRLSFTAALVLALVASAATGMAAPITLGFTGGFQTFMAPTTGLYNIVATGAQGGAGNFLALGGLGAQIGGDFLLDAGEVLQIAVGGAGQSGQLIGYRFAAGGGGGGTFVVGPGSTPLVIAGGGGGAGSSRGGGGLPGPAGGGNPFTNTFPNETGGMNGGGGAGNTDGGGGGGGGFYGAGMNAFDNGFQFGAGGASYPSLMGGAGAPSGSNGNGGFGGGGGAGNGTGGGGGGSFDGGSNPTFSPAGVNGGFGYADPNSGGSVDGGGVNSGDGSVVVTFLNASVSVPEPASLVVLGIGLAGLLTLRRRLAH